MRLEGQTYNHDLSVGFLQEKCSDEGESVDVLPQSSFFSRGEGLLSLCEAAGTPGSPSSGREGPPVSGTCMK